MLQSIAFDGKALFSLHCVLEISQFLLFASKVQYFEKKKWTKFIFVCRSIFHSFFVLLLLNKFTLKMHSKIPNGKNTCSKSHFFLQIHSRARVQENLENLFRMIRFFYSVTWDKSSVFRFSKKSHQPFTTSKGK